MRSQFALAVEVCLYFALLPTRRTRASTASNSDSHLFSGWLARVSRNAA